ncbi:hypothetical protein F5Y16DRAFT_364976 [Xylariaceae sp. FL0255]|nr:hypothetical protein F5Y16DRAFT_364976 [Xylariaceae sp. FL0255]
MDPGTAIGVAAAALQFADAAVEVFSFFREIQRSADSTTEQNRLLERRIIAAKTLRTSLNTIPKDASANDPIVEFTLRCTEKADKLLYLLGYVRGVGENITSVTALYRAIRKKEAIEKVQKSLKEDEEFLRSLKEEKYFSMVDRIERQQRAEFTNLSGIGQQLSTDLAERDQNLSQNLSELQNQIGKAQQKILAKDLEDQRRKNHDKFLESLYFPDIDLRRSQINEPAPDTIEWLFEKNLTPKGPPYNNSWSDFSEWLRDDTSTYWVSGKAGSGKSTLMAHIINDARTGEGLRTWSRPHQLYILSFFFWRAGSVFQHSIIGLLRSFLYQLCTFLPDVMDTLLEESAQHANIIPTWTERTLFRCIKRVFENPNQFRFCVFIDGLDELSSDCDSLLGYISTLRKLENVKLCLSSRPEVQFQLEFKAVKQLRLQDFNAEGIRTFVTSQLLELNLDAQFQSALVSGIAERSEGMFLWAALVTRSLRRGFQKGDDKITLLKRLGTFPTELDSLFRRMLEDVEDVHQESLAYYLRLLEVKQIIDGKRQTRKGYLLETSIEHLTLASLRESINSYQEFGERCQRTETQIVAQSAGLLEIIDHDDKDESQLLYRQWKSSRYKFITSFPYSSSLKPTRSICTGSASYSSDLVRYERRKMSWIHRSAFEFFFGSDRRGVATLPKLNISHEEILERIGRGIIDLLSISPSSIQDQWTFESQTGLGFVKCSWYYHIKEIVRWIGNWQDDYPCTASKLLDKLSSDMNAILSLENSVAIHKSRLDSIPDSIKSRAGTCTLMGCLSESYYLFAGIDKERDYTPDYYETHSISFDIQSKLKLISKSEASDFLLLQLLIFLVEEFCNNSCPDTFNGRIWWDPTDICPYPSLETIIPNFHLVFNEVRKRIFSIHNHTSSATSYRTRCILHKECSGSTRPSYLIGRCVSWKECTYSEHESLNWPAIIPMSRIVKRTWHCGSLTTHTPKDEKSARFRRWDTEVATPVLNLTSSIGMCLGLWRCGRLIFQVSPKVWWNFKGQLELPSTKDPYKSDLTPIVTCLEDYSALTENPDAIIRIVCVPTLMKESRVIKESYPEELDYSTSVILEPCTAAWKHILSLFALVRRDRRLPSCCIGRSRERRDEVLAMVLRDIRCARQGLSSSQQLLAAACFKTAWLDPEISEDWHQPNLSKDFPTFFEPGGHSHREDLL